jgi:hypothetical protein
MHATLVGCEGSTMTFQKVPSDKVWQSTCCPLTTGSRKSLLGSQASHDRWLVVRLCLIKDGARSAPSLYYIQGRRSCTQSLSSPLGVELMSCSCCVARRRSGNRRKYCREEDPVSNSIGRRFSVPDRPTVVVGGSAYQQMETCCNDGYRVL